MKKRATKSAAAKTAMAQKGTFEVGEGSQFAKPCSRAVAEAFAPFSVLLSRAQNTWGQRLLECAPPQYVARYRELVSEMDYAMRASDAKTVGEIAGKLCKALPIMHRAALDAGHSPASSDIVTMEVDGTVFAFVVTGDLGMIRRDHPDWVVYSMRDAVYAMRGRLEEVMQEAAKHYADVKIVNIRRVKVADEIPF
tara:strand:+ start:804 stop:1388 length:585 start_codon:yes stop_codon:yes gene_type:complete